MRSIQRRLGLAGVLLVVGLAVAQTSLWLFDLGLRGYLEEGLKSEAEGLLSALERGANGIQLDERRLNPVHQRPYSGRYFLIELDGRTWRSRSLWDSPFSPPAQPGLAADLLPGPNDQQLLVYRGDYRRFGKRLSISVAQDYRPLLDSFRRVQRLGLGLGPASCWTTPANGPTPGCAWA